MGKLRRGKEPPPDLDELESSSGDEEESSTESGQDEQGEEDYDSSTGDWETDSNSDSDEVTQIQAAYLARLNGPASVDICSQEATTSAAATAAAAAGTSHSLAGCSSCSTVVSTVFEAAQADVMADPTVALTAAHMATGTVLSSSAVMEAMLAVLDSGATGPLQSDWFMSPASQALEAPVLSALAPAFVPGASAMPVRTSAASSPATQAVSPAALHMPGVTAPINPPVELTYWERYEASQLLLSQQDAQRHHRGLAPITHAMRLSAALGAATAAAALEIRQPAAATIRAARAPAVPPAPLRERAATAVVPVAERPLGSPAILTYWERHEAAQLLHRQQEALAQESATTSFTQAQRNVRQEPSTVLSRLLQALPLATQHLHAPLPSPHSIPTSNSSSDHSSSFPSPTVPNSTSTPSEEAHICDTAPATQDQNTTRAALSATTLAAAAAISSSGSICSLSALPVTTSPTIASRPQAPSPFSRLLSGFGLWGRTPSAPGTPVPLASASSVSVRAPTIVGPGVDAAHHMVNCFSATIASITNLQDQTAGVAPPDLAFAPSPSPSPPSSHELMQLALRLNALTSQVMQAAALAAALPQVTSSTTTSTALPSRDWMQTGATGTSVALLRPLPPGVLHLVGDCLQALQSIVIVDAAPSVLQQQQRSTANLAAVNTGMPDGCCRSHSVSDLRDWSRTSSSGQCDDGEERAGNLMQQHCRGVTAAGSRSCSNLAAASLPRVSPAAQPLYTEQGLLIPQHSSASVSPFSAGSSTVLVSNLEADVLSCSSSDDSSGSEASSSEDSSSEEEDASSEGEDSSREEEEVVLGAASHGTRILQMLPVTNPFGMMTADEPEEEGSSDDDSEDDSTDESSEEDDEDEYEETGELEDIIVMSSDEEEDDDDDDDDDDDEEDDDDDDEDEDSDDDDYEAEERALEAYNSEAFAQGLMMGAAPGLNMVGHGGHGIGSGGFTFGAGLNNALAPPQSAMQALQEAAYAQARAYGVGAGGHWHGANGMLQHPHGMLPTFNMPLGSRPVIVVMRSNADGSDVAYVDPDSDSEDSVPDLLCPSCMAADEDAEKSEGLLCGVSGTSATIMSASLSCASAQNTSASDEDDEDGDQCWLCFSNGPVESLVPEPSAMTASAPSSSTVLAGASGSSNGCQRCWSSGGGSRASSGGKAGAVKENMDALVDPCGVCMGGMKYIHRSCFDRYLSTTWSLSCPNCARPYTLPALQSCSTGRMLLSLAASASPDQAQASSSAHSMHSDWVTPSVRPSLPALVEPSLLALRQQYPAGAMACVQLGRVAQLLITCEGTTPLELLKVVRNLLDGFATEPLIASTATGQTIELRGAHTISSITIVTHPAPTGAAFMHRMGYPNTALAPLLEQIMRTAGPVARDLTSSLLTGTGEAATTVGYQRTLALIRTLFAAHSTTHGGAAGVLGGAGGGRGPLDLDLELLSLLGNQAGGAMGIGLGGGLMMGGAGQQQQPGQLIVVQEGADGMAVAAAVAPRRPRAPAVAQAVEEQQRAAFNAFAQQERHAQRSATQSSHQRQNGGGSGGSAPRQRYHAGGGGGGGGQGRRH